MMFWRVHDSIRMRSMLARVFGAAAAAVNVNLIETALPRTSPWWIAGLSIAALCIATIALSLANPRAWGIVLRAAVLAAFAALALTVIATVVLDVEVSDGLALTVPAALATLAGGLLCVTGWVFERGTSSEPPRVSVLALLCVAMLVVGVGFASSQAIDVSTRLLDGGVAVLVVLILLLGWGQRLGRDR